VLTLPAHLGLFADVRARAHEVRIGDLSIPIAHRDDLLAMKLVGGSLAATGHSTTVTLVGAILLAASVVVDLGNLVALSSRRRRETTAN